jgi:IclR family transcriptional regulator, KDG regulon repressor
VSRAVIACLDLLDEVVGSGRPLGLMELCAATGVDKTTASRHLKLLVDRRMLERDAESRKYAPGPQLMMLASPAVQRGGLRSAAAPHLDELRDLSGETVSLHARVGSMRLCIDGRESAQPIRRALSLYQRLNLADGPSGKTILAYLPPAERQATYQGLDLDSAQMKALEDQLAAVRAIGACVGLSDRTEGVGALSCPVFAGDRVVGAITIAGPITRWTERDIRHFIPRLVQAAGAVSQQLGEVQDDDYSYRSE